ncbi:general secretion pathway protein GspK [Luteimonas yindakuii]|uniref:general secretion pathway protein GspK n=1 Tax=Luteimonas yindakuii TaxID=2565782 RepID=UPI0011078370|nr:type II secretion system protein GspK [Luteimonas yindakuii]QCU72723.1 general secretion pathway protein GspK [Luteimonas yindakuii]
MKLPAAGRHARGAALLLVLWLIALLAALVGAFALTARTEHLQGRVLHRGVVATEAARAGLEYAVARVIDTTPEGRWLADGREYGWRFHDAGLTLRIVDEAGKVDLNVAQPPLLAALLRTAGAEAGAADQLAGAIVDWRDTDDLGQPVGAAEDPQYAAAGIPYGAKDAPFEDIGELQQVLGMTPALYAAVAPHVTVHSGLPSPDPRFAGALVLQAIGIDPQPVLDQRMPSAGITPQPDLLGAGTGTYSIDSHARLADGREAVLRAVVRVGGGAPGTAYTPLFWNEGVSVSESQPRP